jgi:hypothetical protein
MMSSSSYFHYALQCLEFIFWNCWCNLTCTQSPQIFHSHTTQRCIYIIADKLCLNKLSQSITHLSRVKSRSPSNMWLPPAHAHTSSNVIGCLSFLQAPRCWSDKMLPNTGSCRLQNSWDLLPATWYSFSVVVTRDRVVRSDSLQSLHRGRIRDLCDGREVVSFSCGNMAKVTLTACHLNAAFWKQKEWKLGEIP